MLKFVPNLSTLLRDPPSISFHSAFMVVCDPIFERNPDLHSDREETRMTDPVARINNLDMGDPFALNELLKWRVERLRVEGR